MKFFPFKVIFACLFSSISIFAQSEIVRISHSPPNNNAPIEITRPRLITAENTNLPAAATTGQKASIRFDLEKQAFELLNEQRREQNLEPLEWSDDVAKIARLHSENMANFHFFSHVGQDGLMVNDRADLFGISRWRLIGENIAFNKGYDNPAEFAVERWMNSPSHRENVLNPRWRESAVGVALSSDGAYYFTEVFLLRR